MDGCQVNCSFHGCQRTYNNPEDLRSHLQDHLKNTAQSLPGKVFLCSQIGCDGSFNNMQQLMDHMRHHYKPNIFFLCESCRAKLRSYRTLLKHLQTCAKVAKNRAAKIETGVAPDADHAGGSFTSDDTVVKTDPEDMEDIESMPTLPTHQTHMPLTQQSSENNAFTSLNSSGPATSYLSAHSPALTPNLPSQPETLFPPTLSPVNLAYQPEPGFQQQRSPRSGPPSLPSSPLLPSSPGSNAVWRKNQDPPRPLLHRWNSPSSQSLSRDEIQVNPSTAGSCGNTPEEDIVASSADTVPRTGGR